MPTYYDTYDEAKAAADRYDRQSGDRYFKSTVKEKNGKFVVVAVRRGYKKK